MGETSQDLFEEQTVTIRPTFNKSIRVEGRPERLTGDAGAILLREVTQRVGLIEWLEERLFDPRDPALITHPLAELLRTEIALLALGWTDADDADFLRDDPALRLAVSNRKQDAPLRTATDKSVPDGLASQPTLSRLLATLAEPRNEPVLQEANLFCAQQRRRWVDQRKRYSQLTVDVDSLPLEVHGHQEGSAYNGHYRLSCYHPLVFGSADIHTLFGAVLRPGNVHTCKGATQQLTKYLDWVRTYLADDVTVRGDAGLPGDDLLTPLEERHCPYVFRFTKYEPLAQQALPYLARYQKDLSQHPVQLRQEEFRCYEMRYKAEDWKHSRRVVLVVVAPPEGELFARSFFLVTNSSAATMVGELLVDLYRGRGTYEDMLGQLKSTLTPQLSSTVRPKTHYRGQEPKQRTASRDAFATNQAILSLNLLAYNLLGLMGVLHEHAHRRPGRPRTYGRSSKRISLDTVRQCYLKVPARVSLHSRSVWLSITQKAAALWQCLWQYLERLGPAPMVP